MSPVVAHLRLLFDILSIKVLVWMFGKDGELLDSHLFFFDKYSDLADYHRDRGRIGKADKLTAIAELHFQLAPDDNPPEAGAMALPAPLPRTMTNAISTRRIRNPRTVEPGATSTLWQWSSFR
jgi:hypothetical protein